MAAQNCYSLSVFSVREGQTGYGGSETTDRVVRCCYRLFDDDAAAAAA